MRPGPLLLLGHQQAVEQEMGPTETTLTRIVITAVPAAMHRAALVLRRHPDGVDGFLSTFVVPAFAG